MNTLSSLFNWLGNLVGANPNTLTTTSKTLIGALNEVDGDISTINGSISTINGKLAWEEISLTETVTTGATTGYTLKAYKKDDILLWQLSNIKKSTVTPVGSDVWAATVTGLPSSFIDVMAGSFYSSSHIDVYFQSTSSSTATITARVSAAQLSSNIAINGISAMTRLV